MKKANSKTFFTLEGQEMVTRKAFARVVLGGVGLCYAAAIGYPVYRYLKSPVERAAAAAAVTEVTLKDAQKLVAGSMLMFKFGSKPAMLIHHADGRWVALDAVCTHLGCTLETKADGFACPCHSSRFDNSGNVMQGPARQALHALRVELRTQDGMLLIH
ncbi:MAG: Rieske (2Fe-2S) protein, partial [Verrucomicrobia bacterium]|nr:Rieske (2Fe-2S) protein [Verrucomicrobiota bacterium]